MKKNRQSQPAKKINRPNQQEQQFTNEQDPNRQYDGWDEPEEATQAASRGQKEKSGQWGYPPDFKSQNQSELRSRSEERNANPSQKRNEEDRGLSRGGRDHGFYKKYEEFDERKYERSSTQQRDAKSTKPKHKR